MYQFIRRTGYAVAGAGLAAAAAVALTASPAAAQTEPEESTFLASFDDFLVAGPSGQTPGFLAAHGWLQDADSGANAGYLDIVCSWSRVDQEGSMRGICNGSKKLATGHLYFMFDGSYDPSNQQLADADLAYLGGADANAGASGHGTLSFLPDSGEYQIEAAIFKPEF